MRYITVGLQYARLEAYYINEDSSARSSCSIAILGRWSDLSVYLLSIMLVAIGLARSNPRVAATYRSSTEYAKEIVTLLKNRASEQNRT